jgi:hypothetical protein
MAEYLILILLVYMCGSMFLGLLEYLEDRKK